ncbi:MAG TPA: hypothetical protein VNO50_22070 [Pyrinomonadaceae bacterium]|nr:hypothetical protein [Pyrinomonadaceae bacterium]
MKNPGRPSSASCQDRFRKLLTAGFSDIHRAGDLFDEFLGHQSHNQSFCLTLLKVAKESRNPWDLRRLAVLMLEHQILKLKNNDFAGFAFILARLNLARANVVTPRIVNSVLKEGYSSTDFHAFIPEFQAKLARLNRVHASIRGRKTSASAISDFIQVSKRNCKLTLARYLFTPEEVVDEILRQVEVTEGVRDQSTSMPRLLDQDVTRTFSLLPDYEANILKRLCESSDVYWVSEKTSSEINSLIEYPATTVVLVIKPPGSDIEFEIKRAGRKGANSLNVVYARNGYTVPPSHRLDGGSMQWLLQYEASHASKLAYIYRLVHDEEAPMAKYPARNTVYSVPGRRGEVQIIPYFTDPALFGKNFGQMRAAMKRCVAAFNAEGNDNIPEIPGDLGHTAQFIGQVMPAQAILCGTSSFRLDKLGAYLSANGDQKYFKRELGIRYKKQDAKQFADELLEEVLGVYQPPQVRYQTYAQYLGAAFDVPSNRARADQNYLALANQIAKFWGTMLAVGGATRGESFVGRNVGLKSYWHNGEWKVRVIFMDHDAMVLSGPGDGQFYAKGALPNMTIDERYIWGRSNPKRFARSALGYLQGLYHIENEMDAQGQRIIQTALKDAYKKTQNQLLTNEKLRPLFSRVFIERLLVWDTLVDGYFQMNGDRPANARWKREMRKMLAGKGYRRDAFTSYTATIEKHHEFLERYLFLFDAVGCDNGLDPQLYGSGASLGSEKKPTP